MGRLETTSALLCYFSSSFCYTEFIQTLSEKKLKMDDVRKLNTAAFIANADEIKHALVVKHTGDY